MGNQPESNALVIANELPSNIVVLDHETKQRVTALITQAQAITVTDVATLGQAEDLFVEVKALGKQISAARLETTRPLDDLKKRIIAAEREATQPLEQQEKRLGSEVVAFRREVERRRQEEERRIRQEREAAERKAREEAEQRRREAEEAAAEEAALFGEAATVIPAVEEPAPVIIPEKMPTTPNLGKSVVRTVKRKVLVVDDQAKVLLAIARDIVAAHNENRQPMLAQAIDINKKSLLDLLKAGVPIDGARVVEDDGHGNGGL